ncbi:PTS transporter subunit EIIC [Romboutsia ilealis]|uniref:PTS transporter subunit EIIC n=1 Tax=Romboutsia ilealis TaxID=1115758 RepID=UPI002ED239AC
MQVTFFGKKSLKILGGIYATTVVTGIHHMYSIIDMGQIANYGYTYWLPIASAANIAQGGATLAVGVKTKNKKIKSLAFPAALSAMLGITDPAIFGINLRYIKPFIGAALGGAAGGLYASIVGLGATGTGVTGIFGILLHLHSPINYLIMFVIALGVAFFTTLLLGWDESK